MTKTNDKSHWNIPHAALRLMNPFRFTGPLLVAFGGLLSIGDLLVVGLTIQQYKKKKVETRQAHI